MTGETERLQDGDIVMKNEVKTLIRTVEEITGKDVISSVERDVQEAGDYEVIVREWNNASVDVEAAYQHDVDDVSIWTDEEGKLRIGLRFAPEDGDVDEG